MLNVLDGYYFDEGFNTKIKEEIQVVFDKRKVEKDAMEKCEEELTTAYDKETIEDLETRKAGHDALQLVYKLILNSTYGKLIENTDDWNKIQGPIHIQGVCWSQLQLC